MYHNLPITFHYERLYNIYEMIDMSGQFCLILVLMGKKFWDIIDYICLESLGEYFILQI